MFNRRKTMLYFAPHQDDELLSMGIDICTSLKKGDEVHVILCTDGSKSRVKNILNDGKQCKKHEGEHCYELTTEEFIQARDREFKGSCQALGVKEENVHILENRDIDGSLDVKRVEGIVKEFISKCQGEVVVCTLSPDNGAAQHRDHKTLGRAVDNLVKSGAVRKARFFVEPYHYEQIAENPRLIPIDPTIQKATPQIAEKLKKAIASYSYWNPEEERYAVGYHSVTTEFDDFLKKMESYSFEKVYPKAATFAEKVERKYKTWSKVTKQKQLWYSMDACEKPDLGDLQLICIKAKDVEGYKHYCAENKVACGKKELKRIQDGSSFWALAAEDGTVMSTGWLAYKHDFYISETDFGFSMDSSESGVLYNFNTKPEYRGRGLYGKLLQTMVSQAEGPKRFVIYTSPDNHASDRGIRKAGFHYDGSLSAADGTMKAYLKKEGFTSIFRKNRFWGMKKM